MKGAFGALQWKPETFWTSTLTEFVLAMEAFAMVQGGEKKPEAPSDDEMADLLAKYG